MTALAGAQVVILSSVDWDSAWQRHHAFAAGFAREGREVFFVENTGFRSPRLSDTRRVLRRLANALRPGGASGGVHPLPERVQVVSPIVLPPTNRLCRALNKAVFLPLLAWSLGRRGLKPGAVAVAYLPSSTTVDLLPLLAPRLTVYDVVDHFRGHATPPPGLDKTEAELLARADVVFTTSPLLQALHEGRHPDVSRIHHGVADEFFIEPPRLPRKHKAVCYFGSLRTGIDYDAINALAEADFDVSLVGPAQDSPPPLHPRVARKELMPTRALVGELAACDALLLPYRMDWEFNQGVVPAKIYECLATGRPVLASALPGLKGMSGLLSLAKTPAGFVEAARALDAEETPERVQARVAEARRHSAAAQFRKVLGALEAAAARRAAAPAPAWPLRLRQFLEGLTWIGLFFGGAKAATWLTQVFAARALGPDEFGKASLVVAVNAVAQVAAMLGFPRALSRFGGAAESDEGRTRFYSTAFWTYAAWAAATFVLLDLVPARVRGWAGLDAEAWTYMLVLAYSMSAYHVTASALQGLTWFKQRGLSEAIYGLGAAASLALLTAAGRHTYQAFIVSLIGGLAAAAAYGLWNLRRHIRPAFDPADLRALLPYAAFGALNILAAAFVQAPGRICLYRYESADSAGIYSAYFTASAQIALAVVQMVSTVLIPLASRAEGQRQAWSTLRRLTVRLFAAGCAVFALSGWLTLRMAGRSYPLDAAWLAMFSVAAAAVLAHGLYAALFAARGFRGLLVSSAGAVLAGLGNLTLNVVLVPRWGITGAALSLLAGYAAGLAWYAANRPAEEERPA